MKRGLWIAIGAAGWLLAGACSYPEFEFRSEGEGGAGGAGGAGGSDGGGGTPSIAIVPCIDGAIICAQGQGCCFDLLMPYDDFCGEPGNCGESYTSLRCNSAADCMNGELCCGTLNSAMTLIIGTICKPACEMTERLICDPVGTGECPVDCVASSYDGYGFCSES